MQRADFASENSEASLIAPCVPQNGLRLIVELAIMSIVGTYLECKTILRRG
jgi:hypothetical protein